MNSGLFWVAFAAFWSWRLEASDTKSSHHVATHIPQERYDIANVILLYDVSFMLPLMPVPFLLQGGHISRDIGYVSSMYWGSEVGKWACQDTQALKLRQIWYFQPQMLIQNSLVCHSTLLSITMPDNHPNCILQGWKGVFWDINILAPRQQQQILYLLRDKIITCNIIWLLVQAYLR